MLILKKKVFDGARFVILDNVTNYEKVSYSIKFYLISGNFTTFDYKSLEELEKDLEGIEAIVNFIHEAPNRIYDLDKIEVLNN